MALVELLMPKMGESIVEATIISWNKQVGDSVEMDETILEIATDKVDSEIPSPVDGVIKEIRFEADDVVQVGEIIALIETVSEACQTAEASNVSNAPTAEPNSNGTSISTDVPYVPQKAVSGNTSTQTQLSSNSEGRFYSPLVRNIAKTEGIDQAELDQVPGTGKDGRVTKHDMLDYITKRSSNGGTSIPAVMKNPSKEIGSKTSSNAPVIASGEDEIVQMDRMRKLIADHMVMSKHTSPHVTSFVEVDVTNLVRWREKVKHAFQQQYGEKITYTPIFIEAVAKAIKKYPMINVSVQDDQIIVKKNINIGMATALPSGNLIVPVLKNADQLNLLGLTRQVNDLANRARINKLKPEEIQGGTFTLTNVGTFGNVMGTPIINQPQVAIMAAGAIRKKPSVLETEYGDVIAIRHMMFLSLSYDHRVVDGMLGGTFLRQVGDYLEAFDGSREI